MNLVKISGSTLPQSMTGRKGSSSMPNKLTTQCEERNDSDLQKINQANLQNISISTIIDIAKFLLNQSEPSVVNQTQDYQPSKSE